MNYFHIAFIDEAHRVLFEKQALSDSLIKPEDAVLENTEILDETYKNPRKHYLASNEALMDTILLFDNIDSHFSVFRWDNFHEMGLTPKVAKANRVSFEDDLRSRPGIDVDKIYNNCRNSARELFLSNKRRILPHTSRQALAMVELFDVSKSDSTPIRRFFSSIYEAAVFEICATGSYDKLRSEIWNKNILVNMTNDHYLSYLNSVIESYIEGLYYSSQEYGAFLSKITLLKNQQANPAISALKTVRFEFGNKIILPAPRNLPEAIELRTSPQIKRLKEVLNEWCAYIEDEDEIRAGRIFRNVEKANSDIKRIKSISSFRESNYFITLNVVGSFIPLFSNILTLVNTGLDIYSRDIKYRSAWIGK